MNSNINFLEDKCRWLRREIFEMVVKVNQGHIASSLSQTEILIALYYGGILNYKKNDPNYKERDKLIISKGHSAMGVYPILADIGYFSKDELKKYGTPEGLLRIYGDKSIPGIECTTGSLAQGPGIAAGFCYAAKEDNLDMNSYVIISDGENYEGSIWETAMFASHYNLDNLVLIIDYNKIGMIRYDIMSTYQLNKYQSQLCLFVIVSVHNIYLYLFIEKGYCFCSRNV